MSKTKLALIISSISRIGLVTAQVLAKAGYTIVLISLVTLKEGETLGAFGMYYDHPALPNEEELSDLESASTLFFKR